MSRGDADLRDRTFAAVRERSARDGDDEDDDAGDDLERAVHAALDDET